MILRFLPTASVNNSTSSMGTTNGNGTPNRKRNSRTGQEVSLHITSSLGQTDLQYKQGYSPLKKKDCIRGASRRINSLNVKMMKTGSIGTLSPSCSQEVSQMLAKNIRAKLNSNPSNCSCWLCSVNTVLQTIISSFTRMPNSRPVRGLTFIRGTGKHLKS